MYARILGGILQTTQAAVGDLGAIEVAGLKNLRPQCGTFDGRRTANLRHRSRNFSEPIVP